MRISKKLHKEDKDFLIKYYEDHRCFPLFNQVLIETRTDCNNRCTFCAHSHYAKPLNIMKMDVFHTIISQLVDIHYAGRIAFFISNEPLLDERMLDMIRYARNASPRFFLDITSNGRLLTLEMMDEFFKAGLDNLNINDYRVDRDLYPDRVSDNLKSIIEAYQGNPKFVYTYRNTKELWPNYGGIIKQDFNPSEYGFCNFPFRKLPFSFDGHALICCNDFLSKSDLGNIRKDNIIDIWNSDQWNKIRFSMINDKRIGLCAKCNDSQKYNIYG